MMNRSTLIILFALLIGAAGCSSSDSNSGNGNSTDDEDTATSNESPDTFVDTEEDEEDDKTDVSDTVENNTGEDTTGGDETESDENTSTAPDMATLSFTRSGQDSIGIEVNIISERITKYQNGGSSPQDLKEEDISSIKENILTDTVTEKMRNGFACGEMARNDKNQKFELEAELKDLETGEYRTETRNVTGCLTEESSQEDAAFVKDLRDKFWNLRDEYFTSDQ
jgi:hypothetical protein